MRTAEYLNIAGLVINTGAAALMYWYPPRGLATFDDEGRQHATWVSNPKPGGIVRAKWQRRWARAAPILLVAGFSLQVIAAFL